ncbi:hypothetical protein V6N13_053907 [Hibiscus sabdariffa]
MPPCRWLVENGMEAPRFQVVIPTHHLQLNINLPKSTNIITGNLNGPYMVGGNSNTTDTTQVIIPQPHLSVPSHVACQWGQSFTIHSSSAAIESGLELPVSTTTNDEFDIVMDPIDEDIP